MHGVEDPKNEALCIPPIKTLSDRHGLVYEQSEVISRIDGGDDITSLNVPEQFRMP